MMKREKRNEELCTCKEQCDCRRAGGEAGKRRAGGEAGNGKAKCGNLEL
jgi:hypothetical protein